MLVRLTEICINCRNFHATTISENIYSVLESLIFGIAHQMSDLVTADTINTFKNRLDKHWINQEVLFDYNVDLTGTGGLPYSIEVNIETEMTTAVEILPHSWS